MGRPTDEVKSHIVKCRIGEELYGKIKGENISEVVRTALEDYVTQKKSGSVPQNKKNDSSVPQKDIGTDNSVPLNNEDFVPRKEHEAEVKKLREALGEYPDKALECVREADQILTFYEKDIDEFWADMLRKILTGNLSDGTLDIGESIFSELEKDNEVSGILNNLRKLCDERDVPIEDAFKSVLIVGAKIIYKDVQGAKLG